MFHVGTANPEPPELGTWNPELGTCVCYQSCIVPSTSRAVGKYAGS